MHSPETSFNPNKEARQSTFEKQPSLESSITKEYAALDFEIQQLATTFEQPLILEENIEGLVQLKQKIIEDTDRSRTQESTSSDTDTSNSLKLNQLKKEYSEALLYSTVERLLDHAYERELLDKEMLAEEFEDYDPKVMSEIFSELPKEQTEQLVQSWKEKARKKTSFFDYYDELEIDLFKEHLENQEGHPNVTIKFDTKGLSPDVAGTYSKKIEL
ncbi:hypothetical protein KKH43_05285 [Patescibacteria group bacterium]|nr:hypothetical protein [Patescibacteria group bacterium]